MFYSNYNASIYSLLVSDGAKQFAIEKKIPTTDPDAMVIGKNHPSFQ